MYLPIEFLILATSIQLHKQRVSSKEVNILVNRCTIPLEWDNEEKLEYCKYDNEKDEYEILAIPNHPMILQILTNI